MANTNYKARAKKAWATRRAKAEKRGVKPGTKRGPYKVTAVASSLKIGDTVSLTSVGSLISELQSSISQLEGQLTAQIDRIKSILV